MPIRVEVNGRIVEFPDGTPEQEMLAALAQLPDPVASHEPAPPKDYAKFGPMQGMMRDQDERDSRGGLEHAPMIGGSIGAALGNVPGAVIGGAAGTLVRDLARANRGDPNTPTTALGAAQNVGTEGAIQGALEGGGRLVGKGLGAIGHGLMRGTVPKNIAKDFADVDIAGALLKRGAVPGSASSARRIEGLSRIANAERDAAAATVAPMTSIRALEDVRPIYQKAKLAGKPERASDVLDYAKQTIKELGGGPIPSVTGPQALARKDILQAEGKAALNASNPRQAALTPQLADAERSAIVSHLRANPRMNQALNESQTMMALDQVMKDAAHSNPVTRARVGGLTAASLSPIALGATAHAVNQGSKVVQPDVARLLMMLMNQRSTEP
jgi:hypothetical protein